ncbi:MAG: hypothetical protein IKT70_03680 [Clostridia bacterium]|nr:hypothetical protein [Clostridia bacterium]
MTKRLLSILLVATMLISFVACASSGDDGGKKPVTTADSVDTVGNGIEYEKDDLPDSLNFNNENITILITEEQNGGGLHAGEILADELNSDVINDSIYNRERYVEDRLGVEILPAKVAQSSYNNEVNKQINSDDDIYQIYAAKTVWFAPFVFDNILTDLYTVDYLDLEKPWWSQYFSEKAEVKDNLYLATGSLSLSLTRFLFVMFYNKVLAENYVSNYPELGDLYTVVENGDWTYDKFYSLSSGIYRDVNGSTTRDDEDVYGVGYMRGIAIDAMWSGFDITIFSRTDDGWFELDVNEDKLYNSLERIRVLLHETEGCYVPEKDSDDMLDTVAQKFADGSLLFMVNKMHAAEGVTLRNMQDEYGIIPYPKYDSKQDGYYSFAHDQYLSFSIPRTNPNPDVAGAVLEAMASYSYRETNPSYFDIALKGKYMNDPQSRRMVDMIVSGFKLDSACIYAVTLKSLIGTFRTAVGDNSKAFSSTYISEKKNIELKLRLLDKLFVPE